MDQEQDRQAQLIAEIANKKILLAAKLQEIEEFDAAEKRKLEIRVAEKARDERQLEKLKTSISPAYFFYPITALEFKAEFTPTRGPSENDEKSREKIPAATIPQPLHEITFYSEPEVNELKIEDTGIGESHIDNENIWSNDVATDDTSERAEDYQAVTAHTERLLPVGGEFIEKIESRPGESTIYTRVPQFWDLKPDKNKIGSEPATTSGERTEDLDSVISAESQHGQDATTTAIYNNG
jgi:hypothetical protein